MKTMTCKQLGGMCDEKIVAETSEEMIAKGTAHLKVAHPQMAADIEAMPIDDPKMVEWSKTFQKTWDATPEDN